MNKLIACCGINCENCDARIATIEDNNELRKATSEKWQKMYNSPGISPDLINCTGCRAEGVKFDYCSKCNIRNCVDSKGYETCGECSDLKKCELVSFVLENVPEALDNLKS